MKPLWEFSEQEINEAINKLRIISWLDSSGIAAGSIMGTYSLYSAVQQAVKKEWMRSVIQRRLTGGGEKDVLAQKCLQKLLGER